MHRLRYAFLLAPIVFTTFFLTVACGGGGIEKQTIDSFFRAARFRDTVTTGGMSMAAFDPRTQGQVESTSLVSVSEEKVTPLHLKELATAEADARKASEAVNKEKLAYQGKDPDFNDKLNRLRAAEQKGQKLKGKDAAFQSEWDKWRERTSAVEKTLSDAREKLNAERGVADMSVGNSQTPVDPTQYDGELASKDVTVNATVNTPDGKHETRKMIITLQQVRLKGGDKPITGKWIITKIQDVAAGGTN